MDEEEHEHLSALIRHGFIEEDLEPVKCTKCLGTDMDIVVSSVDGGHVSEQYAYCGDCDEILGYWAFGFWQV